MRTLALVGVALVIPAAAVYALSLRGIDTGRSWRWYTVSMVMVLPITAGVALVLTAAIQWAAT